MYKSIVLKIAAHYSKDRINAKNILSENYVSIDNLLENKNGITRPSIRPNGTLIAFRKGDILIGNIRPYLKKIWYATFDGGCSPDVLVFRANDEFDKKFLFYCLFRDDFFIHLMKGKKGTKMPRGDKDQAMDFLIPDFKRITQQNIANALSPIDSKIELNNQINIELEALSKSLFDYWFVQFDFPNNKRQPYKSVGGKMLFDETLKIEIPIDWKTKQLSNIANIMMGQSPAGETFNDYGDGMIFFQGSTDFGWRFPQTRQFTTRPTRISKSGDILLSVRAPVGTFNIANVECSIGRGLASLNSKDGANSFLFELMKGFKQVFDRINVDGTTFGSITKDDLYGLLLVYPPPDILKSFEEKTATINQQILTNHNQNLELSQLRDWLLPMLMNRQVTVKEAYAQMEQTLSMAAESVPEYATLNKKKDINNTKLENDLVLAILIERIGMKKGEVVAQKNVFNIRAFNPSQNLIPKNYNFINSNYGTYTYELTNDLNANPFLVKETIEEIGEVFIVNPSKKDEVIKAINLPENKDFIKAIDHLLSIYELPFIKKKTRKIELLNTIVKLIIDKQTTDLDEIYKGMEEWRIAQNKYKTKAEKFSKDDTQFMLILLEQQGLVNRLLEK